MSSEDQATDTLSPTEWNKLQTVELILQPFQKVTKRLEGNAVDSHHGSIWEALPAVELLLKHLERQKEEYWDNNQLSISINLAWSKLNEYYTLMDDTPIYAAALFLHPKFRFDYFKRRWNTETLQAYQEPTLAAIRKLYNEEYRDKVTRTTLQALQTAEKEKEKKDGEEDIFEAFLNEDTTPQDEFDAYLNGSPTALPEDANLFKWWANSGSPQLTQMAFDILSIPAMSSETERVFSGAKLTITPNRNRLNEDIIEATECLNRWNRAGLRGDDEPRGWR